MRLQELLVALAATFSVVVAPVQAQAHQIEFASDSVAKRDLAIAEFYRNAGNPGAAKFYYQLVQRRYPGTPHADAATSRLATLK
jgi:outer membrane protein assembly factor BamD (BamD/ComL family)